MRIDVITIFPEMFTPILSESIVKRAQKKKKVSNCYLNLCFQETEHFWKKCSFQLFMESWLRVL